MKKKENLYITTPIYYTNDNPHIGHSYTNVIADVLARFKRLDEYNVYFTTGGDEHGKKIEYSAKKKNITLYSFINIKINKFVNLIKYNYISINKFIRTSNIIHKKITNKIWEILKEKKSIYLGKYKGWYSIREETYYSELDIINNKVILCENIEWIKENTYFFKLNKCSKKILKIYKSNNDFIKPYYIKNEVIKLITSGLKDLSISRSNFNWGIKIKNSSIHVMYVWFEALISYISGIQFKKINFWPPKITIIGKDILRFHSIYLPALLITLEYSLPKTILVHGWLLNKGVKISKSFKNNINPYKTIKKFGSDYLRYYFIKETNIGKDSSFSHKILTKHINNDLVNKIGNYIYRTMSIVFKTFYQVIPIPKIYYGIDNIILLYTYVIFHIINFLLKRYKLKYIINIILRLVNKINIFINIKTPWKQKDFNRLGTILYILIENIRVITILLQPIIPFYTNKVFFYFRINKKYLKHINIRYSIKTNNIFKPIIIFCKIL